MRCKLTEAVVRSACVKTNGGQELIWDTDIRGFGLLCSKTMKSFVVQRRNTRKKVGRWPELSVAAARDRARRSLIAMDDERSRPSPVKHLTLEEALKRYLDGMRQRDCSERSIAHLNDTIRRYIWDWRAKELQTISREAIVARHTKIGDQNGKFAANAAMRALRTVWNDSMLVDDTLPPAPTVVLRRRWFKERRRQEPVKDLAAWAMRVAQIENPIRRHLQWFLLLTGLRSHDARTMKWIDIDFQQGTLHRPRPKGGSDRAFTVPLSRATMVLLRLQRRLIHRLHPESVWVFPTTSNDGEVTFIKDPLERTKTHIVDGERVVRAGLPTPHRLRDTYTTLCVEAGLSPFDIDVLTNHRPPTGTVTAGYVRQSPEHLKECQEKVTGLILRKTHLRAGNFSNCPGLKCGA